MITDIEKKRQFRRALTTRAVVADEPPRQTIISVQRDINRETAVLIPSYSANQRTANRVHDQMDRPEGRNRKFQLILNCQSC